jgi:hypothetical protein
MRHLWKLLPAAGFVFAALPVMAAQGSIKSMELHDWNRNGKIDRLVMTVDNPSKTSWSVRNAAGLQVLHNDNPVRIAYVFVASAPSADPVIIEAMLDETDPLLPKTTSGVGFEAVYTPTLDKSGIGDGAMELQALVKGDGYVSNSESDKTSPTLLSSSIPPSGVNVATSADITLTFSEAIAPGSFVFDTTSDPGSWSKTWNSEGTAVTLQHQSYNPSIPVNFTVTSAQDLSGNNLVRGDFPNPIMFRTATLAAQTQVVDALFSLTSPAENAVVQTASLTAIKWYANQVEAAKIRLLYSIDSGSNYASIATVPYADRSFAWYPPASVGPLKIKAEMLNAQGGVMDVAVLNLTVAAPGPEAALRVVSSPTVSETTDTSAKISFLVDVPAKSLEVTCGQSVGAAQLTTSGLRPISVIFSLSGLKKDASYACAAKATDHLGGVVSVPVPVFTASTAGDVTAPKLIGTPNVDMMDPVAKTARLRWTTDELSTFEVSYGEYLNYGKKETGLVSNDTHVVTLSGLKPGAMHQVRVTMIDSKGNAAVSKDFYFVFLLDGTLIKGSGSSVYWYVGGKRYVFPHETIYKSWFADFSKVVTIPDSQMSTIPLGGNVQMRGGTWLMKIQSDPRVYVVEPGGLLRGITSEAQAQALFGAAWSKQVRDIDVSFFTDYKIGADLADGEYPDGYFARTPETGKLWYLTSNTFRQEVSESALKLNSIDAAHIHDVNSGIPNWDRLTVGSPVHERDSRMQVVRGTVGGSTTNVVSP